jgi:hypothetical protein
VAHVALLLPWITAVVAARLSIRDNSFLWHVTAGRLQIADGAVLTTDPFSFTHAGEPWRTQSWLLELGYGFFDDRGGLSFVTPFIAVTATLLFAFVLLVTYRQTRSLPATVIVGVLTAWLSAAFLSPRPVLVSYLLLAIVVAATTDKRLRWVLPLVAFIWAAVHGSFILGIGYVVLVGLLQRDRRRLTDAVAMMGASTFTAHGWGVWQVLIEFGRSQDALDLITEWATPDLTKVALIPFLIGTILLIVAGIRGHLAMRHLWIVVPFFVFAATATRAVFPAWVVLAPFAGLAMASVRASTRSGRRETKVLTTMAVILLIFPLVLPVDGGSQLSEDFPVEASEALTADRIFHDDYTGGYLIYRYGTDRPVFIDDRAELYGADHLRSMIQARNGFPGWREVFDEWAIEQVLIRPDNGIATVLEDAGWVTDYEDEEYLVLSKPA